MLIVAHKLYDHYPKRMAIEEWQKSEKIICLGKIPGIHDNIFEIIRHN